MSERHPDGFPRIARAPIGYREPDVRVRDYREIYTPLCDERSVQQQGERCMDCGVPTCMGGCPIGNLIPDWNHLVSQGQWREALRQLHATNNFPEFTGYTCPAPCEPACVLALGGAAVAIKSIERAIVDKGWSEGWIVPEPPSSRTGYRVAVVGSGPAGLAAAQQLNRAGHLVTVFERDDAIGGLMVYGIPDFKFAKHQVRRRVRQLAAEGIVFRTEVNVGVELPLAKLREEYDAVCLALGAQAPRDLAIPGRGLEGVELAMPYLIAENRRQAGREVTESVTAKDRRVVVLGGGDTGADCVATALRQGALQVVQVDINTPRSQERPAGNPWPEAPLTYSQTYAQEEGSKDEYGFETTAFETDAGGRRVVAVRGQRVTWEYSGRRRRLSKRLVESDVRIPTDLVLIALGFLGPETVSFAGDKLALRENGTLAVGREDMMTNLGGVFAAGDANMGQSLVVWAIGEGRDVARAIDLHLTGDSRLPSSIRTVNAPTEWQLGP
ncbi:MAG: glutamate synthase subunit beta [Pseudomonadota bacterium]|nr:glutamate synthase subunit beta [Pseudomonadota bacterium]